MSVALPRRQRALDSATTQMRLSKPPASGTAWSAGCARANWRASRTRP